MTDSTGAPRLAGTLLAGLVSYQPGAVVSRTLVKKPTGTVTLFAFDEGQELSEHTAPFDALVYVVEGQAHVRVSGVPLVWCPSCAAWARSASPGRPRRSSRTPSSSRCSR